MKQETKQKLPKWFKGELYEVGDEVRNPFSGDTCLLTAVELSMYDFIMGANLVIEMGVGRKGIVNDVRKGLSWFRTHNPSAYMTLLD